MHFLCYLFSEKEKRINENLMRYNNGMACDNNDDDNNNIKC